MAEIVLDGVAKRYPNGTIGLRQTSLTIRDGEFFILVGPSGCGKSTLLNMIVGLETVSEGEIRVDGRRVNEIDPKDRNMAMVFQNYALYPHLSARENIEFPLVLAKVPGSEIRRRVGEVAEILQLTGLLERKPHTLSGGQRQRVAMGRAIVRHPAVFLMDEPLSNLDARLRVQMRAEIARLQDRLGVTTIYVTHDQTEAMTLGDRVAVLKEAEVLQVGTPRELYRTPADSFVAGFIGSPGMNFMPAEIRDDGLLLPFASFELPERMAKRLRERKEGMLAGIRPEDLLPPNALPDGDRHSAIFPFKVEVVEWLGAEVFVHGEAVGTAPCGKCAGPRESAVATNRVRLIARVDPDKTVAVGATMELCCDWRRIHLFGAETGKRIACE